MSDLDLAFHRRIASRLQAQSTAIARYSHLLDAQQAALHAPELELLPELAAEAAGLAGEIEAGTRHLRRMVGELMRHEGVRCRSVRARLDVLALDLGRELTRARQLTEAIRGRREAVVRMIVELGGGARRPPGKSSRAAPAEPAFLDRSG